MSEKLESPFKRPEFSEAIGWLGTIARADGPDAIQAQRVIEFVYAVIKYQADFTDAAIEKAFAANPR